MNASCPADLALAYVRSTSGAVASQVRTVVGKLAVPVSRSGLQPAS